LLIDGCNFVLVAAVCHPQSTCGGSVSRLGPLHVDPHSVGPLQYHATPSASNARL
jgi:hypothetical protein